jgi:tetratricopeptide (TPR) repeat protein
MVFMKQLLFALILLLSLVATARAQEQADSLAAMLAEARTLISEGRPKDAIIRLQSLAQPAESPASEQMAHLLGMAYYYANDYARAIKQLSVAAGELPKGSQEQCEAVQTLGLSLYLLGRFPEAIPYLEQTRGWAPDSHEIAYVLGMACIQTRQPDKGREAFARMFRVAPDSPAAHLLAAQMMVRVELDEMAEAELKQALAKEPKLPMANYLLGQMAIFRGRLDEGIQLLEREIAINPGHANAYYKLGDAYARQLRWDEAIVALQKSIWLNPWYSGPYILLGKSYLKKRQWANAEGMLKRAIQFDPNNKSAHYLLGQVYQQSGRGEEAKREFAIAEKLPGNP